MSNYQFAALLGSRGVIAVGGKDRVHFLQGLVTNNVTKLAPGKPLYSALLTPQGKLMHDFFMIDAGERILLDIARDQVPALVKRLTMYKLRADVTITDVSDDFVIAAFWGTVRRGEQTGETTVYRDPRLDALGLRAIAPKGTTFEDRETTWESEADYRTHRLSLGIAEAEEICKDPLYPLEANFEPLHGVDFKKGCYVGQELTARMKLRAGIRKRIFPLTFDTAPPAPGAAITDGERDIATLLAVEGARGLALVRLDRLAAAEGRALTCDGQPVKIFSPEWLGS